MGAAPLPPELVEFIGLLQLADQVRDRVVEGLVSAVRPQSEDAFTEDRIADLQDARDSLSRVLLLLGNEYV